MKRVVLFDFHNTLATCDRWLELEIKTLPGLVLAELRARGVLDGQPEHSVEEANALFRELRGRVRASGVEQSAVEGTRSVMRAMGYEVAGEQIETVVEELEYACLADVEVILDAKETVQALFEAGYELGIVSSAGFPPFVERALEMLGLRRFFKEVLTSAGEGIYKSNPKIFRRAVSRLGAQPSEAVHIGDHAIYDVQTAKLAGLSTIWFAAEAERTARLHNADWEELRRVGSQADAVVTDLREIPAVIRGMGDFCGRGYVGA